MWVMMSKVPNEAPPNDAKVTPAGSTSTTWMPVAVDVLLLVMVTLYMMVSPGLGVALLTVLCSERSMLGWLHWQYLLTEKSQNIPEGHTPLPQHGCVQMLGVAGLSQVLRASAQTSPPKQSALVVQVTHGFGSG